MESPWQEGITRLQVDKVVFLCFQSCQLGIEAVLKRAAAKHGQVNNFNNNRNYNNNNYNNNTNNDLYFGSAHFQFPFPVLNNHGGFQGPIPNHQMVNSPFINQVTDFIENVIF